MTKDAFESRRVAFEAEYFRKKDAQLVAKLKQVFHRKLAKTELALATGINDEAVLDTLVELNLSSNLLAAFELYPLIELAWADGNVDERERNAVLAAAAQHGIDAQSPAYVMLDNALRGRPRPDMRKAWHLYASELCKVLTQPELETFRNDLLEYARSVAAASGGLLNLAFTTGATEKEVMKTIERALSPDS